jgi:hypothetical protein
LANLANQFANAFSVAFVTLSLTQGCSNPGLKLVNACGVHGRGRNFPTAAAFMVGAEISQRLRRSRSGLKFPNACGVHGRGRNFPTPAAFMVGAEIS